MNKIISLQLSPALKMNKPIYPSQLVNNNIFRIAKNSQNKLFLNSFLIRGFDEL